MTRPLVLIGGGGHCKSVIDVAETINRPIMGILDKRDKSLKDVLGYPILGSDDDIAKYVDKADFVITVGQIKSSSIRRRIADLVEKANGHFATLVASDAYVSKHAIIGEGTVIMHRAFINAGTVVGRNSIVNSMANLEHDVSVGDFTHISTGVMVNGEAKVGNDCFVGSGAVLFQGITIEDAIIVPAGSVVKLSIPK